MTTHHRRTFLKTVGSVAAAATSSATVFAQPRVGLPPVEQWLTLKPDGGGIVRFSVDVAVLGHTDAIDPSGRIGPRDSQNYFSIDVRGDTFYVEGALYPGGTISDPTVVTQGRPGGRASKQYQQVWDFTKAKPAGSSSGSSDGIRRRCAASRTFRTRSRRTTGSSSKSSSVEWTSNRARGGRRPRGRCDRDRRVALT